MFAPEHQLIIRCARVRLTHDDRTHLRALAGSDLDWTALVDETLRQCLVGLVYRHLQAHCSDLVPSATLAELRQHYLRASARSLALAAELREVTILLDAGGIASLPYKGPILAMQAYGDIALRTFTDLDLIVHPGDVERARRILASRGYRPLEELTPSREASVLRLDHNLALVREEDEIVIELHWRVAPAVVTFAMPMQLLWDRASTIEVGDTPVRAMSTSDLILVLAVHGTRHAWSAVEWIGGIAELMRQPDAIDWEQVMREAEDYRVARSVRLALRLANRLLEAPLPEHVAGWIGQDRQLPRLVQWVAARLFVPVDSSSASEQWAGFRFELTVKDSAGDRLRDGWCRIFQPTSKDWAAAGLPDRLFALYHVLRPFRLAGRYLASAATRVKAPPPASRQ